MPAAKHVWAWYKSATLHLAECVLMDFNIELITFPRYFTVIFWIPKLRWHIYSGTWTSFEIFKGLVEDSPTAAQGHLLSFRRTLTWVFSKFISKWRVFLQRTSMDPSFNLSQIEDRCCSGNVLVVYEFPFIFMPVYAVCSWSLNAGSVHMHA